MVAWDRHCGHAGDWGRPLVTLSHEIYYDHLIKFAKVQGAEAEPNKLGSYIEELFHCMLNVSLRARKPLCD